MHQNTASHYDEKIEGIMLLIPSIFPWRNSKSVSFQYRFLMFDRMSESTSQSRINIPTLKKKVEVGDHYFTAEEIDAIWWDGYEHGSLDSTYSACDKGYAAAIDDYDLYWREE